ncbi:hypothetical protein [Clostridiisalibacter paucivorans]|uniref:hypothetical protein n=1 Tax=Clostridiisalibacter paucivorans TaxID=408753 RepID=UPI00047ABB0C|nr:hypothetical protein [Clostridiisalibacter paucivorans]
MWSNSLEPRLDFITNILDWYICHYGLLSYTIIIVGSIYFLCIKALLINIKNKQYDRVLMLIILMLIILGSLIGFGIENSR